MNSTLHADLHKHTANEMQQRAEAERRARELREETTQRRSVRRKWRS